MNIQENEVWKDVLGYEGIYKVSNLGRVRVLDRTRVDKNGVVKTYKGKVMKISDNGNGYKSIRLCRSSRNYEQFYVHRLVMYAFIGVEEDLVVDHINRNPSDNRFENLRYCTQRENVSFGSLKRKTSSKYVGVYLKKERWCARIRIDGDRYDLGRFDSEKGANEAYQKALKDWKNNNKKPYIKHAVKNK